MGALVAVVALMLYEHSLMLRETSWALAVAKLAEGENEDLSKRVRELEDRIDELETKTNSLDLEKADDDDTTSKIDDLESRVGDLEP